MDSSPLDFTSRGKLCQFETIIQKLMPQDFKMFDNTKQKVYNGFDASCIPYI